MKESANLYLWRMVNFTIIGEFILCLYFVTGLLKGISAVLKAVTGLIKAVREFREQKISGK